MATVNVVFFNEFYKQGVAVIGEVISAEDITSSGTSQASTGASTGQDMVKVTALGGNVRLNFGASPTALATGNMLLLENDFVVLKLQDGYKVAVIDN